MAKLPTKNSLSAPASFRSGRVIASQDTTGVGRGIQALGDSIGRIGAELESLQRERNAVDIARAEAYKSEKFIEVQNDFENDPDYTTYTRRAEERTGEVVKTAADLIRDPAMRERWVLSARPDAARVRDTIHDRGVVLQRQAEVSAFDNALETNRRVYVDPDTDEAAKSRARADIEGAIVAGEQSGLLTPAQAEQRREAFLRDADFSRGQLLAERDPSTVPGQRGQMASMIAATSEKYGVPAAISVGIAKIESGLNPAARAATSSAGGLFQFIDGTAAQYGLTDKFDPQANADAGARLTRDNIAGLRGSLGRDPSPGEVYLAHFSGLGVAEKLAAADPDTPTSEIFSPAAIRANRSILAGKTAGDVRAWADRKMARAMQESGYGEAPEWFERLSPEQQFKVRQVADTARNKRNAQDRAAIDIAMRNAPVAIQNTGSYEGILPTIDQFMDAYGPQDGAEKFSAFQMAVETAQAAHDMRTMSPPEIEAVVDEARPRSSGDNAALEQARYETLAAAAQQTMKARTADPVIYTRRTFEQVDAAWQEMEAGTGSYEAALAETAAAQRMIGVAGMRLLPTTMAADAVKRFNDVELPERDRIDAVTGLVLGTTDAEQRRAVFDQLVEAGLPDVTEGALEAAARGDTGAARRLFQAAMIDPGSLPGQSPYKPAEINEEIQSQLMDVGQIGDVYYGLSDGTAENFVRAQRDQKLMANAVEVRVRAGEKLDDAVSAVAKDLYGDVKVVDGNSRVNAQIVMPVGEDERPVLRGLESMLPMVEAAMGEALAVPEDAPTEDGTRAVLSAATRNYIGNVLAEGYFRNAQDGFVFMDPYTGLAVAGPDGSPLVFGMDEVLAAPPPAEPVTQEDREREFLEQRYRLFNMMGGGGE